jgi:antibiotic biosynthesis monooxygenase (ABM) superfamily enzyme
LNCVIIAGAGYLVSFVPLPLPFGLTRVLAIGVAMFLITRYTKAEIFPDVILMPLIVELCSVVLTDYVLIPLVR